MKEELAQKDQKDNDEEDEVENKKTALMVASEGNYYNPITVAHLIRKRKCDVEVEDSCGENVVIQAIKADNEVVTLKLLTLCHSEEYPYDIDVNTWRSRENESVLEVLEQHEHVYSTISTRKGFFSEAYREYYESDKWYELQSL